METDSLAEPVIASSPEVSPDSAENQIERVWGKAPYPLVPASLRAVAGEMLAPDSWQAEGAAPLTLQAFDRSLWLRRLEPTKAQLTHLVQCLTPLLREHAELHVVDSVGGFTVPIVALCLAPQTERVFAQYFGDAGIRPEALTFGQLLDIAQVGPKRTLEFACALEALIEDAQAGPRVRAEAVASSSKEPSSPRTPREIKAFFRVLAAWAAGERGEQTLKDALPPPKQNWPPELVQLWKRVRYCSAPELAGGLRARYDVPQLVAQAFEGCNERHLIILQARVLTATKPTSLDSLASALAISGEEGRTLQRDALSYLERLQTNAFRPVVGRARMMREKIGAAVPARDSVIKQALDWVIADFPADGRREFARELMLWLAGPYRLQDGWYVVSADLPVRSTQALLEHRDHRGVVVKSAIREVLSGLAIHPKYHEAWIDRLGEFIGVADGLMSSAERITAPVLMPKSSR
jgi:hypothetical protein